MIELCGIVYTCFVVGSAACSDNWSVMIPYTTIILYCCCTLPHPLPPSRTATGVGFVGRHFTAFLINQKLASKVRVVDKVPPATGWLNAEHSVSTTEL